MEFLNDLENEQTLEFNSVFKEADFLIKNHINFMKKILNLTDEQVAEEYKVPIEILKGYMKKTKILTATEYYNWLSVGIAISMKNHLKAKMDYSLYFKLIDKFRKCSAIEKAILLEPHLYYDSPYQIAIFGNLTQKNIDELENFKQELTDLYKVDFTYITKNTPKNIVPNISNNSIVFYETFLD